MHSEIFLDCDYELLLADPISIGFVRQREEREQVLDLLNVVLGLLILLVARFVHLFSNSVHTAYVLLSGDVDSSFVVRLLLVELKGFDEEVVEQLKGGLLDVQLLVAAQSITGVVWAAVLLFL